MKYTLALLLLGTAASFISFTLGKWWHLLHWFSFSCLILSTGYAGLGPMVFGKRPDGRIPPWSKACHLPTLVLTGLVWHLLHHLSNENPFDQVRGDLILSRRLLDHEVPPGITNFVDLTSEMEDPPRVRKSDGYLCLPILDGSIPSTDLLRSTIGALAPGATLVHCAQGHGRTALFALALLFDRSQIGSFEDGMSLLESARPGVRLNRRQETFVREYCSGE